MSDFDWDPTKERRNARKHGVTFDEAASVIRDPLASRVNDRNHSGYEERVTVIGWTAQSRLLVVIVSLGGPVPRIISARRATKRERHAYEARP
jgi:uncharacterized DUF497 family protein